MIISKYIPLEENIKRLNDFNVNILFPVINKISDNKNIIETLNVLKYIIIGEMNQLASENYYTKRDANKYFKSVKGHDDNKKSYIDHLNYIFSKRNNLFLPGDLKIEHLQMESVFLCNKITYNATKEPCVNELDVCYSNLEYKYSIYNTAYKLIKYYKDAIVCCNFKFNLDEFNLKFSNLLKDLENFCNICINDLTQLSILTENEDIKNRIKLLIISKKFISIKDDLYEHTVYSLNTQNFENVNSLVHSNIYSDISSIYNNILSKYLDDQTTKLIGKSDYSTNGSMIKIKLINDYCLYEYSMGSNKILYNDEYRYEFENYIK